MSVIDIFHAPRCFVFEDFETRGVLTVRGEVTADVDVTVKNGFVVVTAKKAAA